MQRADADTDPVIVPRWAFEKLIAAIVGPRRCDDTIIVRDDATATTGTFLLPHARIRLD